MLQGQLKPEAELAGFVPYGVGKRMCPSVELADMQVSVLCICIFIKADISMANFGQNPV